MHLTSILRRLCVHWAKRAFNSCDHPKRALRHLNCSALTEPASVILQKMSVHKKAWCAVLSLTIKFCSNQVSGGASPCFFIFSVSFCFNILTQASTNLDLLWTCENPSIRIHQDKENYITSLKDTFLSAEKTFQAPQPHK